MHTNKLVHRITVICLYKAKNLNVLTDFCIYLVWLPDKNQGKDEDN